MTMIASPSDEQNVEDALKMLGRVADAFDNPSLHKTDRELLFVVNVVKSRQLWTRYPSEESVCPETSSGSCDSLFDRNSDQDVERVEFGDASVWQHASSYPYVSRGFPSHGPTSFSERVFRQTDGMYDINKMLLASSPLDRLDRLARIELKRTGWFERANRWTVVEMGLQGVTLPTTPPKRPSKKGNSETGHNGERESSAKTKVPNGEKGGSGRCEAGDEQSDNRDDRNGATLERNDYQGEPIEASPRSPTLRSPGNSQESDSYLVDFSTLNYTDASRLSHVTTPRSIRISRSLRGKRQDPPGSQPRTRARFGQVVRNFVKKMLPPTSSGGGSTGRCGNGKGPCGGSPPGRTSQVEMTPRSEASGESGWTFASASNWMDGWTEHQGSHRWSGFWHG